MTPQESFNVFAGISPPPSSSVGEPRYVEPDPEDEPTSEEKFIPDSQETRKRYTKSVSPLTQDQAANKAKALAKQGEMIRRVNQEFELGDAAMGGGYEVPGAEPDGTMGGHIV